MVSAPGQPRQRTTMSAQSCCASTARAWRVHVGAMVGGKAALAALVPSAGFMDYPVVERFLQQGVTAPGAPRTAVGLGGLVTISRAEA